MQDPHLLSTNTQGDKVLYSKLFVYEIPLKIPFMKSPGILMLRYVIAAPRCTGSSHNDLNIKFSLHNIRFIT